MNVLPVSVALKRARSVDYTHHTCLSHRHTMTSLAFVSLVLVAVMVSTASAQGGIASCCRVLTNTQVHRDRLTRYYRQDQSSCPLDAVVFFTMQDKRICADPNKMWTQTSMAYLDGKNWQRQQLLRQ